MVRDVIFVDLSEAEDEPIGRVRVTSAPLKIADEPRTIPVVDPRKRDLEEKLLGVLNAKDEAGDWKVGLDMAVASAAAAGFTGRDIIGAFKSCLGKGTLIREAVESAAAVLGVEA